MDGSQGDVPRGLSKALRGNRTGGRQDPGLLQEEPEQAFPLLQTGRHDLERVEIASATKIREAAQCLRRCLSDLDFGTNIALPFNLMELRYVIAVPNCRSFCREAEALSLKQSALRRPIRLVEKRVRGAVVRTKPGRRARPWPEQSSFRRLGASCRTVALRYLAHARSNACSSQPSE
jgi:hypothetical protein